MQDGEQEEEEGSSNESWPNSKLFWRIDDNVPKAKRFTQLGTVSQKISECLSGEYDVLLWMAAGTIY